MQVLSIAVLSEVAGGLEVDPSGNPIICGGDFTEGGYSGEPSVPSMTQSAGNAQAAAAATAAAAAAANNSQPNPCGTTITQQTSTPTVAVSAFPPNVTITYNPTVTTVSTVCPAGVAIRPH